MLWPSFQAGLSVDKLDKVRSLITTPLSWALASDIDLFLRYPITLKKVAVEGVTDECRGYDYLKETIVCKAKCILEHVSWGSSVDYY